MIYRAMNNLETSEGMVRRGCFILGSRLSERSVKRLISIGAIAVLHAPPLEVLPGFETQAMKLSEVGITDFEHLLEADIEKTASALDISESEFRGWRDIASNWLVVPEDRQG